MNSKPPPVMTAEVPVIELTPDEVRVFELNSLRKELAQARLEAAQNMLVAHQHGVRLAEMEEAQAVALVRQAHGLPPGSPFVHSDSRVDFKRESVDR